MTRTLFTLVRHGETAANLDGVWHGSIDTPLTQRGLSQADRVARYLGEKHADASAIYASPLERARRTAQAIADGLGLPVALEDGLAEYHLGSWEGKSYRDLFHEHRLFHRIKDDPDFAPHGGESPRQVTDRFVGALRRIADRHPASRVIVVAHGGALSLALAHLLEGSYRDWGPVMDNCAVSELVLEPHPELLTFNRTEHLADL